MTLIIKISGHELDDPAYLSDFARTVGALKQPTIIVHGGGKEISQLQQKLGIEPRYVDGLRITDADSLALVEMVLCGTVNKRLTRVLLNAGVNALGISGVDGGIISAEKMRHPGADMGFTGTITAVRTELLSDFLDQGIVPVIAPICLGKEHNYNVNADHVAGTLASALGADQLVFLSNVSGVLQEEAVVPTLTAFQTEAMIENGAIFGGMIPKVRTALEALKDGVKQVVITDLHGLQTGGGTTFVQG